MSPRPIATSPCPVSERSWPPWPHLHCYPTSLPPVQPPWALQQQVEVQITPSGARCTHFTPTGCGAVDNQGWAEHRLWGGGAVIMCKLSFQPFISLWGWGAKMPAGLRNLQPPPGSVAKGKLAWGAVAAAHCAVNETCL